MAKKLFKSKSTNTHLKRNNNWTIIEILPLYLLSNKAETNRAETNMAANQQGNKAK